MPNAIANMTTSEPRSTESNTVLSNVELPLRGTYFPMGFPVTVATNSTAVLAAAEQSWRLFRPRFSHHPPLLVELGVTDEASEAPYLPPAPLCRVREHLLSNIADASNFIHADLKQGYAFGWVTRATAESTLYLRYYFLEAAALAMLSTLRATALHAACVAPFGRGVLLCGRLRRRQILSSPSLVRAQAGPTSVTTRPISRSNKTTEPSSATRIRFVFATPEFSSSRNLEGRPITPRATGKPSIEVSTPLEFPELIRRTICAHIGSTSFSQPP